MKRRTLLECQGLVCAGRSPPPAGLPHDAIALIKKISNGRQTKAARLTKVTNPHLLPSTLLLSLLHPSITLRHGLFSFQNTPALHRGYSTIPEAIETLLQPIYRALNTPPPHLCHTRNRAATTASRLHRPKLPGQYHTRRRRFPQLHRQQLGHSLQSPRGLHPRLHDRAGRLCKTKR